ncbi:hypothetical protein [Chryseobacterium sp. R2ACT005]|uniref:hypothetical protein n=1 Tax=Chryseobacterium sp. R2ACT005 TaxID=3416668 RepID=UPI003CF23056
MRYSTVFCQVGINALSHKVVLNNNGAERASTKKSSTEDLIRLQQSDDFVIAVTGTACLGTIAPHSSCILEMELWYIS